MSLMNGMKKMSSSAVCSFVTYVQALLKHDRLLNTKKARTSTVEFRPSTQNFSFGLAMEKTKEVLWVENCKNWSTVDKHVFELSQKLFCNEF